MTDDMLKKCPKCGQQLRFPEDIGGMLMACPSCGNKFQSGVGDVGDVLNLLTSKFDGTKPINI